MQAGSMACQCTTALNSNEGKFRHAWLESSGAHERAIKHNALSMRMHQNPLANAGSYTCGSCGCQSHFTGAMHARAFLHHASSTPHDPAGLEYGSSSSTDLSRVDTHVCMPQRPDRLTYNTKHRQQVPMHATSSLHLQPVLPRAHLTDHKEQPTTRTYTPPGSISSSSCSGTESLTTSGTATCSSFEPEPLTPCEAGLSEPSPASPSVDMPSSEHVLAAFLEAFNSSETGRAVQEARNLLAAYSSPGLLQEGIPCLPQQPDAPASHGTVAANTCSEFETGQGSSQPSPSTSPSTAVTDARSEFETVPGKRPSCHDSDFLSPKPEAPVCHSNCQGESNTGGACAPHLSGSSAASEMPLSSPKASEKAEVNAVSSRVEADRSFQATSGLKLELAGHHSGAAEGSSPLVRPPEDSIAIATGMYCIALAPSDRPVETSVTSKKRKNAGSAGRSASDMPSEDSITSSTAEEAFHTALSGRFTEPFISMKAASESDSTTYTQTAQERSDAGSLMLEASKDEPQHLSGRLAPRPSSADAHVCISSSTTQALPSPIKGQKRCSIQQGSAWGQATASLVGAPGVQRSPAQAQSVILRAPWAEQVNDRSSLPCTLIKNWISEDGENATNLKAGLPEATMPLYHSAKLHTP
jgi:hypothetical protein